MVLEKLGSSLRSTMQKITQSLFVDDSLLQELIKDIQRALLQADVNVQLVFSLTNSIKSRMKNEQTPPALTKKEHLVHIMYEELVKFLGGEKTYLKINSNKKPNVLMLVGLYGSGKTTTCGKLARYFAKRGKKVALVGLDVWRPAASDQLEQIAKLCGVPVFVKKEEKNPVKIFEVFKDKYEDFDLLIVDTAGRDALNDELIEEIKSVNSAVKPDETLLVISGDIGQAAQKQAQTFHDSCGVTGVIATKMEGTAKAGGALSACAVTEAPIKFIGVGEKIDDIEPFNPKGFVGRMLGMGDIEGLIEKAETALKEEDAKDLGKKFLKGEFNLIDLYEQMQAMRSMGPLRKIMEMIPGMGSLQIPKEALDVQDEKLKRWEYAMKSMTKDELENPESITGGRVERIAQGSGVSASEIRGLVKQYKQSKKMMKMFKSPEKMMQKLQKSGMKLK